MMLHDNLRALFVIDLENTLIDQSLNGIKLRKEELSLCLTIKERGKDTNLVSK